MHTGKDRQGQTGGRPPYEFWMQPKFGLSHKQSRNEAKGPCPHCGGEDRFSVRKDGLIHCRKGCAYKDMIGAAGWDPSQTEFEPIDHAALKSKRPKFDAAAATGGPTEFDFSRWNMTPRRTRFCAGNGKHFYEVRMEPKDFKREPDGFGGIPAWPVQSHRTFNPQACILIVEGPKKVAHAINCGHQALSFPGGSNTRIDLWPRYLAEHLTGGELLIFCPDTDKAGQAFMEKLYQTALNQHFRCALLNMDGTPEKADIADFDADWLAARIAAARFSKPRPRAKTEVHVAVPEPAKADNVYTFPPQEQPRKTFRPINFRKPEVLPWDAEFPEEDSDSFFQRGEITLLLGQSGHGKSTLAALMMLEAAAGENLLQQREHEIAESEKPLPMNVLGVWSEEFVSKLIKKMKSAVALHQMDLDNIRHRILFIPPKAEEGQRNEHDGPPNVILVGPDAAANADLLADYMIEARIDFIVLDTASVIMPGAEDTNKAMNAPMQLFRRVLTKADAAGVLIHHTSKNKEAEGTHRARGASTIDQLPRLVFEIQEQENNTHCLICQKDNYGGKKGKKYFYQRHSVVFDLAKAGHPALQSISEPEKPEDAELDDSELLCAVRAMLKAEPDMRMKDSKRSREKWAGYRLAAALGWIPPTTENQSVRKQTGRLLKAVEMKGWIKEDSETLKVDGKVRKIFSSGPNLPGEADTE